LEVRGFALRVILAVAKDEGVAAIANAVLGAQRKRREVGIGDVGDDQAERKRPPPDEALGDAIRPVAEPFDDVLDAATGLAAGWTLARQDVGNRTDGDVRSPFDVSNGYPSLARLI